MKPASATIRPASDCGTPSGPISPRRLADSGKIDLQRAVVEPGREQQVAGRDLAGFEGNAAIAVPGRLDRSRHRPRMFGIIGTDGHDHAAAARPLEARA